MFFVTQSNLSQVVMLLNCILVAPDLDLGREIKYSVAFHFLCPSRQMSGWQLQLGLSRFFTLLSNLFSQIIIPFYTLQYGLMKASLNKPHRLHELLEVRSIKPCSLRSWCFWSHHFCFGLPSVRCPLGWYRWASGRPSSSASPSSSFLYLYSLFILPPF